ncbi:MAG: alpha/beta fold hydrolase [Spirochaeta sp.]|jgi:branched-chain amino acid transport system permease protein|nr:alpha/beta fold hydrolase [Spirochaeta sp.]
MYETKRVTVDNVKIAYWDHGHTGAPVLLYVHGNTGGKLWFESVMAVDGYRTIAPDLPNFGDSDRLDTADIDRYAFYLARFLTTLEITDAAVVGHSLGGAVAIALAAQFPTLVSRLLLVDSAPVDGLHTPEEYYPVIERYKDDPALLKNALRSVTPTMEDEAFLDRLTETAMQMNPIAFAGNPRALDRFDYRDRVGDVRIMVLVVRGELDGLITEDMARATAAAFPKGEFRFLHAVGHSVMVEDPGRFRELVQEFGAR